MIWPIFSLIYNSSFRLDANVKYNFHHATVKSVVIDCGYPLYPMSFFLFEDTKWVIRSRKQPKKDIQYHDQKKKGKRTNIHISSIALKSKKQ
jgi:hypothetical protein